MERQIGVISDSGLDYGGELYASDVEPIPFRLTVDEVEILDLRENIGGLLQMMKSSTQRMITACPSPSDFLAAFDQFKETFVVTISSRLSGSYNSAMVAKQILEETEPDKKVHIIDSRAACAGQDLIFYRVKQLVEQNISSPVIVDKVTEYVKRVRTFGVLQSLDNLVKNGRISNLTARVGNLLQMTPIIGDDHDGHIVMKDKVFGKKKVLTRVLEIIGENAADFKDKMMIINHVNAQEKAEELKQAVIDQFGFHEVHVLESGGISTVYADDGGIMFAF